VRLRRGSIFARRAVSRAAPKTLLIEVWRTPFSRDVPAWHAQGVPKPTHECQIRSPQRKRCARNGDLGKPRGERRHQ
jgi:hypothetical protein